MQVIFVSVHQLLRLPLLLVVLFTISPASAQAQSETIRPLPPSPVTQTPATRPPSARRPNVQTASGQSTVKGRVFYKDNAQALKGVRVQIFAGNSNSSVDSDERPPGRAQQIAAFTNDRGEFQVENLAAGKYYLTVEGSGIVTPSGFGMRIPLPMSAIPRREDFEEIVPRHDGQFTVDGTNTVQIEVAIARGGTISGKVLRPDHGPVGEIAIRFVSRAAGGIGPSLAQFSTQTDKDGEYRMPNLPPGEYLVAAATEDKRASFDMLARMRGESQIVTYHPAAISVREAMAVKVDPGRETSGVNITLVARNTFSVSGTVVRRQDGTLVAGAIVLLRNKDSETGGVLFPGMGQRQTRSDEAGRWTFNIVSEGSYVAIAMVPASPSSRSRFLSGQPPVLGPGDSGPPDRVRDYRDARQKFLVAEQVVALAGSDSHGLTLAIVGPGSIRGSVSTDNGAPLPANLVIFLELATGALPSRPLPVRVGADGSFNVGDIQGGDIYLAAAMPPGSPYFIKSLTVNGEDPRRTPLKIIEDAEAGPLQIVISNGLGLLRGRVLADKSGEGLRDYMLLLAPTQSERQRFRTAFLTARTAPDGTFSLSGEPGEYFILARKRDEFPPIVTEEFIKAEGLKAQRIVLVSGEQKSLDLRIP